MSGFEPIAIIGRACLLPGAKTPSALFNLVKNGIIAIGRAPRGRWGMDPVCLLEPRSPAGALISSDCGGYVADFDAEHSAALRETGGIQGIERLDVSVAWLLHCARTALADAGIERAPAQSALIVGNLSYPSEAMTRFIETFWLARADSRYAPEWATQDARNRFCSGLPTHLVANALGIAGAAYALDAACASSLYAIKLACDQLQDRRVELALAGGLARGDDLFIHLGFTALQALSPTGQSRPFDRAADGLVPAEGAGLIVVKRLDDAVKRGDRILGIIRGIGLSNDGRQNGFLAPARSGQVAAMRAAYEQSGLSPGEVDYVECHATGTARGDAIEIESLGEIWRDEAKPVIGSLKGNIGHTITASGVASLIKVLSAFEARILPPMICAAPIQTVADAGFTIPTDAAAWESQRPRRAAISNFGFGGNNAHLIVEEWCPGAIPKRRPGPIIDEQIAVVGLGILAGDVCGRDAFARRLMGASEPANRRTSDITLRLDQLGFPPNDLKASLAQQTAILAVADEALEQAPALAPERTGVFVGMGCDTSVARHGIRLKLAERLGVSDDGPEMLAWRAANGASAPHLTAAGVIGTMPNIPANRLHSARDWKGQGFTVSSEELSGVTALEIAVRALRMGELDAALVAASDFSCEPAHEGAIERLDLKSGAPGDAAVALVLMRANDVAATGGRALALLGDDASPEALEPIDSMENGHPVATRFGHAHAASGLMEFAGAIILAGARVRVDETGAWPAPRPPDQSRRIHVRSLSGRAGTLAFKSPAVVPAVPFAVPGVRTYQAADSRELIESISTERHLGGNAVRLALVGDGETELQELKAVALAALRRGVLPTGPGIHYGEGSLGGELAFTFTGAAAAYPGAGRDILLAFPEIGDRLAERFSGTPDLARSLYGSDIRSFTPMTQLTGCALVCQAHAELTRGIFGMRPSAAIGLSSGETNALLAFGVWRDLDAMLAEIDASGLYDHELTGAARAARLHWGLTNDDKLEWRCWRIAAPVEQVRSALAAEPRCYLSIIHAPEDCVISGDAQACERVIGRIGRARAFELGLDMVVHCPALKPFASEWERIHTREAFAADGVRFYTNAGNRAYVPTREAAAAAITRQALETIDFPSTVLQAYDDGVRVFVEHGPRAILTSAIGRILDGKPHLAVALDRREQPGLKSLASALLQLWTAGAEIDLAPLKARLAMLTPQRSIDNARQLKLPAHRPDIVFPRVAEIDVEAPVARVGRMTPPEEAVPYDLRPLLERAAFSANDAPTPSAEPQHTDPIVRLFSDVAHTHRTFLARQKVIEDQFLALQFGDARRLAAAGERPKSRAMAVGPLVTVPPARAWVGGVPVVVAPAPFAPSLRSRPNLHFDREDLIVHAGGRIADLFGPQFAMQDAFARQVRMPEPPLLLADRVVLLEGEAGSMGRGRVVTETVVRADAWYLHCGRMSPGLVIESGQADLFLISWLGADLLNRGERVYRLLGCDLTFHGDLPRPGETLRYDIHVDGHAKTGDVRLFFFHYDCYVGERLLLSVRDGQAGFFSDAELASSGGVLWDAKDDPPKEDARLDSPPHLTRKRAFIPADVQAFADGNSFACFGAGFERAAAHQRTPGIPTGRLKLIDRVAEFDPAGGPWGRGYLRAQTDVPQDAWFYQGHFKNDPCMPGTLMADAATQALAFAMAAMGFTISRDGWRFAPVPDSVARFVCRGQVTPDRPHTLEYEIFIEEIIDGDEPAVFAALLCRSDGFKVFGCRRFGLRLVPDWPLTTRQALLDGLPPARIVGPSGDVRGDEAALLACAWGPPSQAFGALYQKFDAARRAPRLPGPPYHFLTRVMSVDRPPGSQVAGATVVAEYDVPKDPWYLPSAISDMPIAVLAEILLQPCGWLASYLGFAAGRSGDVLFRNLDGEDAAVHRAVTALSGTLKVTARLERFAQAAGSTIVFFTVRCECGDDLIAELKTDFGFFEPSALETQIGLPVTEEMRGQLAAPSAHGALDLGRAHCAVTGIDKLRLIDEITGYWQSGGAAGLGRIRARQIVDPSAWYFKAHFFQDPVQPGSLGLEALSQLVKVLVVLRWPGTRGWQFEAVAPGEPIQWRFRGQVTPETREVTTEIEALEWIGTPGRGVTLRARGNLWADGKRIYEMPRLGVRATGSS